MPNSILESKDAEYTPSSSSLAPSNPQPTPDSNRSDTENSFTRGRIPGIGLRKLKTDFGMDQELGIEPESHRVPAQHLDNDEEYSVGKGYESPVMVARKRYTREEEQQVIKKFDRRLVLFMALLYLLSFLDRSSEYSFLYPRLYGLSARKASIKRARSKVRIFCLCIY